MNLKSGTYVKGEYHIMRTSYRTGLIQACIIVCAIMCGGSAFGYDWQFVEKGLHGAVGSELTRYDRNMVPQDISETRWHSTAWRGERISGHIVLWTVDGAEQVRLSVSDLTGTGGAIPASSVDTRFTGYVLADDTFTTCGQRPKNDAPVLVEDIIDTADAVDMGVRTVQPVWFGIDVPANTKPGVYSGYIEVLWKGGNSIRFDIGVEVLDRTLPPPAEWHFHLDLWQHPWAVARYHRVQPWSEEHWNLMRPIMETLAEAGQKCLTATIVKKAWNGQTFDHFESMVGWTKTGDKWSFDYTIFDEWVRFGESCGFTGQINCYSMIPWGYNFYYTDGQTGDEVKITCKAGSPEYTEMWTVFLADFTRHLKERGWFDRTVIAMDERPVKDMLAVVDLVRSVSPGLKLALAGGDHPELYNELYDYCVLIPHELDSGLLNERRSRGEKTTYYVCCTPFRPNTFTISPLPEALYIGWYAYAAGYDGFLRWAAQSWVEDPLHDSSFRTWQSGDTYVIYPGPRSSLRFELLRDGIEDYEKLRILNGDSIGTIPDNTLSQEINNVLTRFVYPLGRDSDVRDTVHDARTALENASRNR